MRKEKCTFAIVPMVLTMAMSLLIVVFAPCKTLSKEPRENKINVNDIDPTMPESKLVALFAEDWNKEWYVRYSRGEAEPILRVKDAKGAVILEASFRRKGVFGEIRLYWRALAMRGGIHPGMLLKKAMRLVKDAQCEDQGPSGGYWATLKDSSGTIHSAQLDCPEDTWKKVGDDMPRIGRDDPKVTRKFCTTLADAGCSIDYFLLKHPRGRSDYKHRDELAYYCGKTVDCQEDGKCGHWRNYCAVTKPEHCHQSRKCKEENYCDFLRSSEEVEGSCIRTATTNCSKEPKCKSHGFCTWNGKQCVPGSIKDCAGSERCKTEGLCAFQGAFQGGHCVVGSSNDCQKTTECHEQGRCSFQKGRCQLTSSDDCRRSALCLQEGRCKFEEHLGCTVASRGDCERSDDYEKAKVAVDRAWGKVIADAEKKRDKFANQLSKKMDVLVDASIKALRQAAVAARDRDPGEANADPAWDGARTLDEMVTQAKTVAGLSHLTVVWGASVEACSAVYKKTGESPDAVCGPGSSYDRNHDVAKLCQKCNEAHANLNAFVASLPGFGSNMEDAFFSLSYAMFKYNELAAEGDLDRALVSASTRKLLRKQGKKAGRITADLVYWANLASWATYAQEADRNNEAFGAPLSPDEGLNNKTTTKLLAGVEKARKAATIACNVPVNLPSGSDSQNAAEPQDMPVIDVSVFEGEKSADIEEPKAKQSKRKGSGRRSKEPRKETLTTTDIMNVVKKNEPAMRTCFKKYGAGLGGATIRTKLTIRGATGEVVKVSISSMEFAGTALGNCVRQVQKKMKFPAFTKPSVSKSISVRLP